MQHGKQPFRARLQLLARLTFNAGRQVREPEPAFFANEGVAL